MESVDVVYNSDTAIALLTERLAEEMKANAILRASVIHYKSVLAGQDQAKTEPTFATVPYSENGG